MSDVTTQHDTNRPFVPAAERVGLRVAVAWHRDPSRIGVQAWVPWSSVGHTVGLSRFEPVFDDGAPIADSHVSRSPLQLLRTPFGLEARPTGGTTAFDLDGARWAPGATLPLARVRVGFRLGLGGGALLHLRLGPPPRARPISTLIGPSQELDRLAAAVVDVARLQGAALILGESGTGKELVAQALHEQSARRSRPFVALNMAALSPGLAASQLFGHGRGAFTGADRASAGYFGQADGGTLFLDEIGACPSDVQGLLLRVLESGEVQVVGDRVRKVDVRVVAATDVDLERACADATFRSPLYHRLAIHTIRIQPLRARPIDVAAQAVAFAREALDRRRQGWPLGQAGVPWLRREVIQALMDAPWPGNSRELRATMERLVAAESPVCELPDCVPAFEEATEPPGDGPWTSDLRAALVACDYRLEATAEHLRISRNALKRRMALAGIRRPVEIPAEEIAAAVSAAGSLSAAAVALGVSEHGLRLRLAEVGLACPE